MVWSASSHLQKKSLNFAFKMDEIQMNSVRHSPGLGNSAGLHVEFIKMLAKFIHFLKPSQDEIFVLKTISPTLKLQVLSDSTTHPYHSKLV